VLARKEDYLATLVKDIELVGGRALAVPTDVGKEEQITAAFAAIREKVGEPDVLLYNAAMRPVGRLMETTARTFENTWRVSVLGAFLCAQQVVPDMQKKGSGVILFTGATAGVKPFPTSAAFGPAKFALRGLAQVLARDLGPQGIHVAYINIDGPIDMPAIRQRFPNLKEEDLLKPSAIADTYWHLAHQDSSSWTQELDVRPFKEKF
jgi:NAD(P)-dependent dehydrogenase (short-subunit alcohol dehydrogenase family)